MNLTQPPGEYVVDVTSEEIDPTEQWLKVQHFLLPFLLKKKKKTLIYAYIKDKLKNMQALVKNLTTSYSSKTVEAD